MDEKLKILIPTDFSVQAEYAYLMVRKLAEKTPVEIHFLHVLNAPDSITMDSNENIQSCDDIDIQYLVHQKDIANRKLDNLHVLYSNEIHTHFVLGKLIDSILSFAESHEFDLIVMGTKGAWGLKEKLSGSETQIVARNSRIPLLSLMCDRSDLNIQNILLVHNFNHPEKEDLQFLHKIIKAFDTRIHLLQITSKNVTEVPNNVMENMNTFAALNDIGNYACHTISDEDVEDGVIHFNEQNNMDIVCIGTHGKGGLFHHSATEKLINHLFKPIISFHLK
ncbi:MAG: universal stress protein [Saprospiraceae bacterium]|nr:universal stress protein [Saprospiraceae bacterium]MBK8777811.1 universal stress protein [Saprospiraceae bacterium]MBK9680947.1 universal stress protein [Saprospiraceae bacterium]MBP7801437.1 universal stress protein [Saprospiraceae bacterium]MBP8093992.1 universal stress protein [Saprospiraceae bacterium]